MNQGQERVMSIGDKISGIIQTIRRAILQVINVQDYQYISAAYMFGASLFGIDFLDVQYQHDLTANIPRQQGNGLMATTPHQVLIRNLNYLTISYRHQRFQDMTDFKREKISLLYTYCNKRLNTRDTEIFLQCWQIAKQKTFQGIKLEDYLDFFNMRPIDVPYYIFQKYQTVVRNANIQINPDFPLRRLMNLPQSIVRIIKRTYFGYRQQFQNYWDILPSQIPLLPQQIQRQLNMWQQYNYQQPIFQISVQRSRISSQNNSQLANSQASNSFVVPMPLSYQSTRSSVVPSVQNSGILGNQAPNYSIIRPMSQANSSIFSSISSIRRMSQQNSLNNQQRGLRRWQSMSNSSVISQNNRSRNNNENQRRLRRWQSMQNSSQGSIIQPVGMRFSNVLPQRINQAMQDQQNNQILNNNNQNINQQRQNMNARNRNRGRVAGYNRALRNQRIPRNGNVLNQARMVQQIQEPDPVNLPPPNPLYPPPGRGDMRRSEFQKGVSNIFAPMDTIDKMVSNRDNNYRFNVFQKVEKRQPQALRLQQAYQDNAGLQRLFQQTSNKVGQNLMMFPQWLKKSAGVNRKINGRNANYNRLYQRMQDPQDLVLMDLNRLSPQQAYWDQARGTWAGKGIIDKIIDFKSDVIPDGKLQKIDKNRAIINQQADNQMLKLNVPMVVRMVINANQQLSNAGIGPKKNGGIPLYAGRWLDPQTGGIKIFPKASQKYVNPMQKSQKMGYLQARILNKWNQFVDVVQSYKDTAKVSQQKFRSRVKNRIKALQSQRSIVQKALKKIKNQYKAWAISQNPTNIARTLFWDSVYQHAGYETTSTEIAQLVRTNDWVGTLNYFTPAIRDFINNVIPAQVRNTAQAVQVAKSYKYISQLFQPMYNAQLRLGALLAKVISLPKNVTARQFGQMQRNLGQAKTIILQRLQNASLNKQAWAQLRAPNTVDQAKNFTNLLPQVINKPITQQQRLLVDIPAPFKQTFDKMHKNGLYQSLNLTQGLNDQEKNYMKMYGPQGIQAQRAARQVLLAYNGELPDYRTFAARLQDQGIPGLNIF